MREHYAEMAERLAAAGGPRSVNWTAVAEVLGEGGLTGADGKAPSADVARKTWAKVVAMMSGRPKASPSVSSPVAPSPPAAQAAPPGSGGPGMSVEAQLERARARLGSGTVPIPRKVERG